MANSKTSDLIEAGPITGTELLYVVQAGADRKTTASDISAFVTAGSAGVVDAVQTPQQVVNTTAETALATLTLPAGRFAQNTRLAIKAAGWLLQSTGTVSHTYRLRANGTEVMRTVRSVAPSGNGMPWEVEWILLSAPTGKVNASMRGGWGAVAGTLNGFSQGVLTGAGHSGYLSQLALDLDSDEVTFTITIEMATASASIYNWLTHAVLEWMPPFA
jgi:hypothetical protein